MKKAGILTLVLSAIAVFAGALLRLENASNDRLFAILGIIGFFAGISLLLIGIKREKKPIS